MRLKNKIGIITAAGSGMGRAGALRFAQEGATLLLVDLHEEKVAAVAEEVKAAGGKAEYIAGDLRDDGFATSIVAEAVRRFGGLNLLWNHVGHPGPAAFEGLNMPDYELAMDLNIRSVVCTTEAAMPEMRKRGGGSVVFTASTAGLHASALSPIYTAAKFAVVGLARGLAVRYAKEGIRINAVCPGPIDTPMLRVFMARPDGKDANTPDVEQLIVQKGAMNPIGRPGLPEEVANAALFLLSDEASFITGVALPVDGGLMA